jgi:hypothetical protein
MGILFNSNTWRAPLQLIDCWLPAPALRRSPAANEPLASRTVQRFARAGWLGRPAEPPVQDKAPAVLSAPPVRQGGCRVHTLRHLDARPPRSHGMRLVISGRINDVCAELDRLADQENHVSARVA